MKEIVKKIINICGAIGITCAFLIGACNSVTNNAVPIKAKANSNYDYSIYNSSLDYVTSYNGYHYYLPALTIEATKNDNEGHLPYAFKDLNDNDYKPVMYMYDFDNIGEFMLFFNGLTERYQCYTFMRIYCDSHEYYINKYLSFTEVVNTYIVNNKYYVNMLLGNTFSLFENGLSTDLILDRQIIVMFKCYYDYDCGVNYYCPAVSTSVFKNKLHVLENTNLIDAENPYTLLNYNDDYLTYNIFPYASIPVYLKSYEYYLGVNAWYLNLPYVYCEYQKAVSVRYYINDETTIENNFINPSISPNGKHYIFRIDEYSILTDSETNKEYVANNFGKDVNVITFVPSLENVLFYKLQGFKAYGSNIPYSNNMPNKYYALRDFDYLLPDLTLLTLRLTLQYNGIYYNSITGSVYYYDSGFTNSYWLSSTSNTLYLYKAVGVYNSGGPMEVTYTTDLTNYVINVIEQPYTDYVYDFISLYTAYEVDKNTIVTNPITNITSSTDIIGGSGVFDLLGSAFNGIYSAFNVMVFPGVTLWALLMIPFVGVILLFIIKLFKR